MAEGAGLGVTLDDGDIAALFGEDQARYLVAAAAQDCEALVAQARSAGVAARIVGHFGGTDVRLGRSAAPLAQLSALYRSAFARAVG
jgi:phosphoribosylformylglycinamidine synthase